MRLRAHLGLGLSLLLSIGGLVACGSGSPYGTGGDAFESDDPNLRQGWPGGADGDEAGGAPPQDDSDSAEREIAEADIIQVEGNRLYALSRGGGLSIIDVGTRDKLRLLGRFRAQAATPFEMYVRGDVVLAMYSDWGRNVFNEASKSWEWVQVSQLIALDVSDPESIREIGQFEMAGEISDSRIVGDVLYLVSYRDGYCWGCGSKPASIVTSIDISDPSSIRKVDELSFASAQNQYGWGKRSVTVTPKRMYVAGPESGFNGNSSSTIQVVDIEDPNGDLVLGASVKATGTIQSRWQMDEHEGVLRVISQPDRWDLSKPPRVQTFEVESSTKLEQLGSLDLVLPRPEQLRSVRFDGTRGYAITFERTDPLFTIDLSNPATPIQKGELEMPGWVHHMEPRGDRLYGLGFDNGNKNGSLNVSIFDVSDLSNPTMLDRVNFGGDWSYLGEDQNRIHKAFQILPDAGLVLVPFSGWNYSKSQGCGGYTSGVQLIDLVGDSLKKRGVAPARGEPRRAFLHQDRLFTVSDERAQVFDIDNRDEPVSITTMKLAQRVDRVIPAGESLVRLAVDWWTGAASLEVVRAKDANSYEPLGSIDLDGALMSSGDASCGYGDYRYYYARMFASGSQVYVLVPSIYWQPGKPGTTLLVIDIQDPTAPRILKKQHYEFTFVAYETAGNWGSSVIETGANVVQIGNTIAVLEGGYDAYGKPSSEGALHVFDLGEPSQPRHTRVDLPAAKGRTALQVYGKTVMLGRWSAVPEKPSRVRFYVDRVDLSKPSEPRRLSSVNVPGSLLSYEPSSQRFITVDYRREVLTSETWDSCRKNGSQNAHFDPATGTCTRVHRTLELLDLSGDQATRIESKTLPDNYWVTHAARGDDRVFLVRGYDYYAGYYSGACVPGFDCGYGLHQLAVIGGARAGKLQIASPKPAEGKFGLSRIAVSGQRLVISGEWGTSAGIVDTRYLHDMKTTVLGEIGGYAYDLAVDGNRAYFALGNDGVQAFELPR